MSELSKKEIEEIRENFDFFDRNHNDLLEKKEFIQLIDEDPVEPFIYFAGTLQRSGIVYLDFRLGT